jgi:hypothetical protein
VFDAQKKDVVAGLYSPRSVMLLSCIPLIEVSKRGILASGNP